MYMYKDMTTVLDEKQKGCVQLQKFKAQGIHATIQNIPEGEYMRLLINNELVMSNTPMEELTSLPFVMSAYGDVLICGLGIGLVILPLLEKRNIKSITVIEKYQDVIDCVSPQLQKYDTDNKLSVICQNCFSFTTEEKFDTIFIDIWSYINSNIYKNEMQPLKQKYQKFLSNYGKEHKNIFVWAEYQAKHNYPLT